MSDLEILNRLKGMNNEIDKVFNKDNIHTKDGLQDPLMIIADTIPVYLMTDNAPSNNFSISIIAESLHSDNPFILVDDYFLELDYTSQLFCIYHELGHYVNKDLTRETTRKERFQNFILTKIKKQLPIEEQKADIYAYNMLKETYKYNHTIQNDPEAMKSFINVIFDDICVKCLQVLKDGNIKEKDLKKYTRLIEKEFYIRKQTLFNNVKSFYDPKKK